MRRVHQPVRLDVVERKPGLQRAGRPAEISDLTRDGLPLAASCVDGILVDDARRPLRQVADLRRADRRLPRPRVILRCSLTTQVGPSHETPARGRNVFAA